MAGIHFSFDNFKQLMDLNIGISDRLDQNRAESFTLLYCNFEGIAEDIVDASLLEILRTSDSIVNHQHNYFLFFPIPINMVQRLSRKCLMNFLQNIWILFTLLPCGW